MWSGAGMLAALLLCGGIGWLLVRNQTKRIRQLKVQAEKLRDADFGETLPESADELGDLAAVFNDIARDRRFREAKSVFHQEIRTCMSPPLKPKEEVRGVLHVDHLTPEGQSAPDDLEFLSPFANQAPPANATATAIRFDFFYDDMPVSQIWRTSLALGGNPPSLSHRVGYIAKIPGPTGPFVTTTAPPPPRAVSSPPTRR